jgi:hypothetical protein
MRHRSDAHPPGKITGQIPYCLGIEGLGSGIESRVTQIKLLTGVWQQSRFAGLHICLPYGTGVSADVRHEPTVIRP